MENSNMLELAAAGSGLWNYWYFGIDEHRIVDIVY